MPLSPNSNNIPPAQGCNCGGNPTEVPTLQSWENEADYQFIQRVANEVTQSCALPFALPVERIPEFILQAAQWFWLNSDYASEERMFVIPNKEIHKCSSVNKVIKLPSQILSVHGVFRIQENLKWGAMGDFSIERMMLSTYSMFGGVGTVGGGFTGSAGMAGFNLTDVVTSMYEISTFDQTLNPPLTYDFNTHSGKLVLLGDLGWSDLLIDCFRRLRIQDLYNDYYFFRYVVCLAKRALSTIYGIFEFKLPGGVTINYSNLSDQADSELEEIRDWVKSQHSCDYFFNSNTL